MLKNPPHSPSTGSNSAFLGRRGVIWCRCCPKAVQELLRAEPEIVTAMETANLLSRRKPWEEPRTTFVEFDKAFTGAVKPCFRLGLDSVIFVTSVMVGFARVRVPGYLAAPAVAKKTDVCSQIPKQRFKANRTGADARRRTPAESLAVLSFLDEFAEACKVHKEDSMSTSSRQPSVP